MSSLSVSAKPAVRDAGPAESHIASAIATTRQTVGRFESALERMYDSRYRNNVGAFTRFLFDIPGANFAVHLAGVAAALAGATYLVTSTAPTTEHMFMLIGAIVGGAVAVFHGMAVSHDRQSKHLASRAGTITYDELKGFVDEVRGMSPEERASLAPEVVRWGEQRVASNAITAPAYAHLRDTVSAAASSDPAYGVASRSIGVANQLLAHPAGWRQAITDLLASCAAEERPAVQAFLLERLFDGETCRLQLASGMEIQQLYDTLTKPVASGQP